MAAKLKLFPHQQHGVDWMIARERCPKCPGGLLLDDCGLGKTPQVIATMMRNPLPLTLVVVPVNIVQQWQQQLRRWAPTFDTIIYHGPSAATSLNLHYPRRRYQSDSPPPLVIITTYGMLVDRPFEKREKRRRRLCEQEGGGRRRKRRAVVGQTRLHRIHWDRIVLDECHLIRNAKTTRARYTLALCGRIHWGLTATPVHNGIQDYYCLLQFLGLKRDEIAQVFASDPVLEKYLDPSMRDMVSGSGRLLDLNTMRVTSNRNPFVRHGEISLRRTKNQVFSAKSRHKSDGGGGEKNKNAPCSRKRMPLPEETSTKPPKHTKKQCRRDAPTLPELTVDIVAVDFATPVEAAFYRQLETATLLELERQPGAGGQQRVEVAEQFMFELVLRLRQASVNPSLIYAGYRRKFGGRFPRNLRVTIEGGHRPLSEDEMFRRIGVPSKTRTLQRLMREHHRTGEKSIVFCEFREEMPLLQRDLAAVGVTAALYDGTMTLAKRETIVRAMAWTNDELEGVLCSGAFFPGVTHVPAEIVARIAEYVSYDAVLVQINSGNAGLNLQMCSRVYFTSPNWNPCIEVQAVSRSHRCGQQRPVRAVKLALSGNVIGTHPNESSEKRTIDQRILEVQQQKRAVMSDILDDPDILHNGTFIDSPNAPIDKGGAVSSLTRAELVHLLVAAEH